VKNAMRLNFTFSSDEEIKDGVKRLADTIRDYL
jgi:DNA-binding transcriptional MocR family regulator